MESSSFCREQTYACFRAQAARPPAFVTRVCRQQPSRWRIFSGALAQRPPSRVVKTTCGLQRPATFRLFAESLLIPVLEMYALL